VLVLLIILFSRVLYINFLDGDHGDNEALTPEIHQGLYGKVKLISGNCMPGAVGFADQILWMLWMKKDDCASVYVSRTIYVREPVWKKTTDSVYLTGEKANLVKQVTSNSDGYYEIELPPGTYSVFVEDNGKEYCSRADMQGVRCPITIGTGTVQHTVKIDHAVW